VFLARCSVPLHTKLVPYTGAPSSFRGAPSGSAGGASCFDNDVVALGNRYAVACMQGQGCGSARRVLLVSPWLHVASHSEKELCSLWSVLLGVGQMIYRTHMSYVIKDVSLVSFSVRMRNGTC